jgi:hypothetical protein
MATYGLVTNNFKLFNAKQFKESLTEPANTIYYTFASKSVPFSNSDTVIAPNNSTAQTYLDVGQQMILGKRVANTDVVLMIPRYDWTTNTIYTAYDHDDGNLFNEQFYVVVDETSEYNVFKVLNNNGGIPSTQAPSKASTSANDHYYATSDGYEWKYMYTITTSDWSKFATAEFVPVIPNADVSGNAISGSIDTVKVVSGGSNYDTSYSGNFIDVTVGGNNFLFDLANTASANTDFYNGSMIKITSGTGSGQVKRIVDYNGTFRRIEIASNTTAFGSLAGPFSPKPDSSSLFEITPSVLIYGDGQGFIARALVNTTSSNSIYKIEIVNSGNGYTYATANVTGNTGGVANAAVIRPIISPRGGHGYDAEAELGAHHLCISTTFSNSESSTITINNDYRTVGIIRDVLFANVELTLTGSGNSFTVGELVTQTNTSATGYVDYSSGTILRLTNAVPGFVTSQTVTGSTSSKIGNVASFEISNVTKNFNTFDGLTKIVYSAINGTFSNDEIVYQTSQDVTNGYFHSINTTSSTVYLTNVKGNFTAGEGGVIGSSSGATLTIQSVTKSDIVKGSGEVLYIENITPIPRSNNQSETFKFILEF